MQSIQCVTSCCHDNDETEPFQTCEGLLMHIPPHAVSLKSAAKADKRVAAKKKKTFYVISIQTLL